MEKLVYQKIDLKKYINCYHNGFTYNKVFLMDYNHRNETSP